MSNIYASFAIRNTTSLFSFSIPDRNLDCITTFYHRRLEGLDHQATVPPLVKVDRFIVINQQFLANELIFFQDEVQHDSPFTWSKKDYACYIDFAFFHKPDLLNSLPLIVREPHNNLPAQNDKGLTRTLQEFTLLTSRRRHFIPKALHANMFLVQQAVDVMDRDVMLLPGETSLDAFVRLPQHDRRVRHVVVTRDEKVVGVVRINTALHHGLEGTYAGVNLEDVASRHFAIAHPEEIMFGSQLGSSEIKYGVLILRNERDSGGFKNCKFSIPVAATKGSVW